MNRSAERWRIWIDRVGSFLLLRGDQISIGGPVEDDAADLSLMAPLSRRHALLVSHGSRFAIRPRPGCLVKVNQQTIEAERDLASGTLLQLGERVELFFEQPTAISATARLSFRSEDRPRRQTDAVILMRQSCVLSAAADAHLVCPDWSERLILFERSGGLWCQSTGEWKRNGQLQQSPVLVQTGDQITGADFRLWLEAEPR